MVGDRQLRRGPSGRTEMKERYKTIKSVQRCLNEKEGRALLSIERAMWLILKWFHYCLTVKGTVTS